ncbi:uncharacterized protein UDID_08076 [Ustilago sp. UG-2017a]|nr:uncharacterized protein UDID_08076 [Ustilago sp. UG-2017a]
MKADLKEPVNVVPSPEAGRYEVNTGDRGGDVIRKETQAHHETDASLFLTRTGHCHAANKPHMHAGANETHKKVHSSQSGPDKPDV